MPYDITMCIGDTCPIKDDCLRFTGERYARQDFFGGIPYDSPTNTCAHFWSNRPKEDMIRELAYQISCNNPNSNDVENWLQAEKELIEILRR